MTKQEEFEQWLDERLRIEQAATAQPWVAGDENEGLGIAPSWCVSQMRPDWEEMTPTDGYVGDVAYLTNEPDAEFIADARANYPKLVKAVREVLAIKPLTTDTPTAAALNGALAAVHDILTKAMEG